MWKTEQGLIPRSSPEQLFKKDDIGVIIEDEYNYIRFNVKINLKLAGLTNKNDKNIRKKKSADLWLQV